MKPPEKGRPSLLPSERGSPANLDAEEGLLACCILDESGQVMAACLEAKIAPDYFFKTSHQVIYQALQRLGVNSGVIDEIIVAEDLNNHNQLEAAGGHAEISRLTNRVETTAHFRHWLEIVREKALLRKFISISTGFVERSYSNSYTPEQLLEYQSEMFDQLFRLMKEDGDGPKVKTANERRKVDKLLKRLQKHKFDRSNPPPKEDPVLWLGGCEVAWRKNMTVILAQKKSAKTSAAAAAKAACLGPKGLDYLGFQGANPHKQNILHLDTEQSPYDHHSMMDRSLRRARVEGTPAHFHSYEIRGFTVAERREIVREEALRLYHNGGLMAIFLDGGADLVDSVNDEAAAVDLRDELIWLMNETGCALIVSIHQNEQAKGTYATKNARARGHVGAEFERKASMTLELVKERNKVTGKEEITITAKDARHGLPPSVTFAWSDQHGMHMTIEKSEEQPIDPKVFKKRRELTELCAKVFQSDDSLEAKPMSHSQLVVKICGVEECHESTAKTRIKDMLALGIIEIIPGSQLHRPVVENVDF